jgi:single-stranded-DNA-specific exonuclease
MTLFERILAARGLNDESKAAFLNPKYELSHDPFLLTDMEKAVKRLVRALKKQDRIVIYGDYDIDGLTSAALLFNAFEKFGFKNVDIFIPNRFDEGYGLTKNAIEKLAKDGTNLVVTVDCGSSSNTEIIYANKMGIDVIVTDHHEGANAEVPAVAVINPKNKKSKYPFADLAGVGVAFKLVQALQTELPGLPMGQEKWLLDLVALGTVCDVVRLTDENRMFVYFGLKVLSRTKRPGLKALMAIAGVEPGEVNARSLGFMLGPRMNAAGRLETARLALDMLLANDSVAALKQAENLDDLNRARRIEQNKIFNQAVGQAEKYSNDPVLIVSAADWNHGVVGIVASKLLEKYKKPTFVLQEVDEESKGSARSYGDFSAIEAINTVKDIINKGGGHKLAVGVTLPTKNINEFRKRINEFYKGLSLEGQEASLLPIPDTTAKLDEVTEGLVGQISQLEPFGVGNPQPIIKCTDLVVVRIEKMGTDMQHMKLNLKDENGICMKFISFNYPDSFCVSLGSRVSVWFQPNINVWRGTCSVEGQLLHIEPKP